MRQWGRVAAGAGAGAGAEGWQPPAHLLPAHGLHHPLPRAAAQVPPNQESKAQTAPALGLAGQVQATVAFLSGSGQGAGAKVGVGTLTLIGGPHFPASATFHFPKGSVSPARPLSGMCVPGHTGKKPEPSLWQRQVPQPGQQSLW